MRYDNPPKVLTVSITSAGAALAARLPFEHLDGRLADNVRTNWAETDAFVLFCAAGIATRVVAPLLIHNPNKDGHEPAVIVVDESASFVVPILGGHRSGANEIAIEVAELLEATPVITTATDSAGVPALDQFVNLEPEGDVA